MIGFIVGLFVHLVLLFGAIVCSKVMLNKRYIDDDEFYNIVAIFVPWAVLVWLGAVYVGEKISDRLK